jgi:hypothetical protein
MLLCKHSPKIWFCSRAVIFRTKSVTQHCRPTLSIESDGPTPLMRILPVDMILSQPYPVRIFISVTFLCYDPHICFIITNRNFLGSSPIKLLRVFLIFHVKESQAHCRTLLIPCKIVDSCLYVCRVSIPSYYFWGLKMYPLLLCFVILPLVAIHILPSKQETIFYNSTKQLVKLLLYLNYCVLECRC